MFDQLDDPQPPALGDGFRRRVRERVRRRRNRRVAVGSALGATVLLFGGLAFRFGSHLGRIERLDVAGLDQDSGATPEQSTILLVGTDARSDPPPVGGTLDNGYADSMVLIRTDPTAGTVRMLSVPRDLRVTDDNGNVTRLAVLHGRNGLSRSVAEIESQLHLSIDHVAVVDLDGFRDLVDELGGVRVRMDRPVRDEQSGLHLDATSCTTLTSTQALALVRARHLEVRQDGQWIADPSGDFGRMQRQQAFLVAALAAVRSRVPNPFSLDRLATIATEHIAVDDGMDDTAVLSLLKVVVAVDPVNVYSTALPTQQDFEDGAALLVPGPGATEAVRWLEGTTPPSPTLEPTTTAASPGSLPPAATHLNAAGGVVTSCD